MNEGDVVEYRFIFNGRLSVDDFLLLLQMAQNMQNPQPSDMIKLLKIAKKCFDGDIQQVPYWEIDTFTSHFLRALKGHLSNAASWHAAIMQNQEDSYLAGDENEED